MRNYIPKKDWVRRYKYKMIFYMICDYKNLIEQRNDIILKTPAPPDGMPRGSGTPDPTAERGVKIASLDGQAYDAITHVITNLHNKYSDTYTGEPFDAYEAFMDYGVFCYYRSKACKDEAPSKKTWSRYRGEFVREVAKKINYF